MLIDNPSAVKEQSFDITHLLIFVWQRKWRIVLSTALIVALLGYFILKLPKQYTASSTILLGDSVPNLPISSMSMLNMSGDNKLDTFIEFIESQKFAQIVVDELELSAEPTFMEAIQGAVKSEAVLVESFLKKLDVNKVRNTDMLKLSFTSKDPVLATRIVNYVGPAFFAYYDQLQQRKMESTSERLNSQVDDINQRMLQAESRLQDYLDQHEIVDVIAQIQLTQEEISARMREKLQNDRQLSVWQQTLRQADLAHADEVKLLQVPWVMEHPMVQQIQQQMLSQEQLLAEVSQRYKSKHHRYIAVSSSLQTLRDERSELLMRILSGLKQQVALQQRRQTELQGAIEASKAYLATLSRQQLELTKLQQEVDSTHKIFEMFMSQLRETELLKDVAQSDEFAVVDYATVPDKPSKPAKKLLIVMSAIIAFILSCGFWLVIHLISDKPSRLQQYLRRNGIPMLGTLPNEGKKHRSRAKMPLRGLGGETSHRYAETIRAIRTALTFGPQSDKNKVIVVTAIGSGHGKASVAINLAESCSNMDKVLLADFDLSKPSIAKAFGLSEKQVGITNFLAREVSFTQCLHYENSGHLNVLPCGRIPNDPLAILATPRFRKLLGKLGTIYPRIVAEAPPIRTVTDALLLSRLADAIVLVCDLEKTSIEDLEEAINKIRETNAPLAGVVFNRCKQPWRFTR